MRTGNFGRDSKDDVVALWFLVVGMALLALAEVGSCCFGGG